MKKLRVTLCVLVIITVIETAEITPHQAEVAKSFNICIQQTGASKKLIARTRKGHVIEDEKLDNFIFCMFRRSNFINENGALNLDLIRASVNPASIPPQQLERLINACGYVRGRSPQNIAGNAYRCYVRLASSVTG